MKATEDQYIDLIRERYSVSTEEASEELKVHRSTAILEEEHKRLWG